MCSREAIRFGSLKIAPDTRLAQYLPRFAPLGDGSDTSEFPEFPTDWRAELAAHPGLVSSCDAVSDNLCYEPALVAARETGLTLPIGTAIFYDTIVQHGNSEDADSFRTILARSAIANRNADETAFLAAFLTERRRVLRDPKNGDTRDEWRQSLPRIEALRTILSQNPELRSPIHVANREVDVLVR